MNPNQNKLQNQPNCIELFRPVGEKEFQLIRSSGFRSFPPRLPEQPIFYPALNAAYGAEIASRWNTKGLIEKERGYLLRFLLQKGFGDRYPVQTVGRAYHQEIWVPADALEDFNRHIVGTIHVQDMYDQNGSIREKIQNAVHNAYWETGWNCARTMLHILADQFQIPILQQTDHAAIGLHGAGGYQAQCGLVEGALMFIGIYGAAHGMDS